MDENEYNLEIHKVEVQWQQENLRGAIALAGQTIKSLELVNGGAAIALLTFYGNVIARSDKLIAFDKGALLSSLKMFSAGVVVSVFCAIFAYLSQLQSATKQGKTEIVLRVVAAIFGLGSAFLFAFGMVFAGLSFN